MKANCASRGSWSSARAAVELRQRGAGYMYVVILNQTPE
jgi:hypothetical protein